MHPKYEPTAQCTMTNSTSPGLNARARTSHIASRCLPSSITSQAYTTDPPPLPPSPPPQPPPPPPPPPAAAAAAAHEHSRHGTAWQALYVTVPGTPLHRNAAPGHGQARAAAQTPGQRTRASSEPAGTRRAPRARTPPQVHIDSAHFHPSAHPAPFQARPLPLGPRLMPRVRAACSDRSKADAVQVEPPPEGFTAPSFVWGRSVASEASGRSRGATCWLLQQGSCSVHTAMPRCLVRIFTQYETVYMNVQVQDLSKPARCPRARADAAPLPFRCTSLLGLHLGAHTSCLRAPARLPCMACRKKRHSVT